MITDALSIPWDQYEAGLESNLADLHGRVHRGASGRSRLGDGTSPISRELPSGEEDMLDKNRIEGSAKQAKGTVTLVVGKVLGDAKLEAEGKTEKIEGKV